MNVTRVSDKLANIREQRLATEALIKFCEDHERGEGTRMDALKACLEALDRQDIDTALKFHASIPLGGNGTFNDWIPPVIFPHETNQYVAAVFDALVTQWNLMMRLSLPKK